MYGSGGHLYYEIHEFREPTSGPNRNSDAIFEISNPKNPILMFAQIFNEVKNLDFEAYIGTGGSTF